MILERGIFQCTTRNIADASPLTKSAIHYYYADVDEIIDLAMARLLRRRFEDVSTSAEGLEPAEAFWTALSSYLWPNSFSVRGIWYEWYVRNTLQKHEPEKIAEAVRPFQELFERLLIAAGSENASAKMTEFTALLYGTMLLQGIRPIDRSEIFRYIARIMDLAPPVAG